ncbi:MAG: alpha-galactosidase, partial [Clostridia bacterium]|nr:alpha-galactosidase [Clostridia bacterium]
TLKEIDIAHRMGIEVFVIDTGWYNKTGDWIVDDVRFPDHLKEVKARLDSYGMKLGLWFNPIVAAKSTAIFREHPEYVISHNGQENYWGPIWETEESYGMCLCSGYTDYFIKRLIELNKTLGVTYFKWDAISQYGCNATNHNHGCGDAKEAGECYAYGLGLQMQRIVEELSAECPDAIVDFDVTEAGRFVGLGFLSVGKYFLINNGPYFSSFDIPSSDKRSPDTINVFFYPGPARSRVCRKSILFDELIPSVLFLTHFLPDAPRLSQNNAIASMLLGGNGIWGDLLTLSEEDIQVFAEATARYRRVRDDVTEAYPIIRGKIGGSPEIYEKLNENGRGMVTFFTHSGGEFKHITKKLPDASSRIVTGADHVEVKNDRLILTVKLSNDEARCVFVE